MVILLIPLFCGCFYVKGNGLEKWGEVREGISYPIQSVVCLKSAEVEYFENFFKWFITTVFCNMAVYIYVCVCKEAFRHCEVTLP